MNKETLMLVGALLFAGAAQADVTEMQDGRTHSAETQKEAPAPTTDAEEPECGS